MKLVLKIVVVLLIVVVGLPIVALSAMGALRPLEGFCFESGLADMGDVPSVEDVAQSYFASPELAPRLAWVGGDLTWPSCIRSRRGLHRMRAYAYDRNLARLAEPNLGRLHETDANARVLRVVTNQSFSRLPISFRLETDETGGGALYATWLQDDGDSFNESTPAPDAYDRWRYARLPTQTRERRVTPETVSQVIELTENLQQDTYFPTLDGNWLAVEWIHDGRREVRDKLLSPSPNPAGRLFCALAELSEVPTEILAETHLDYCATGRS